MEPIELSDAERFSTLWIKLEQYMDGRIEIARAQLEGSLSLDDTNRVRGRLVELRELKKLGDPPQRIP